jgi:DNA topoisomerase-1
MAKPLIIVESPAKTRTLRNLLGPQYTFGASMGHVRDLPKRDMGLDIESGFTPKYQVLSDRREHLKKLKGQVAHAGTVYIATDPDREGEAIAWHLQQALELEDPHRIEFNEITRSAVQRALEQPRKIDMDRVYAQQARRVLDRLVGYKISPVLWKQLGNKSLSAGRVQTVALRLVVEREREIRAFVPEEYWTITAKLTPEGEEHPFEAELKSKGDEPVEMKNQEQADAVMQDLQGVDYVVRQVKKGKRKRGPAPPFITSTLQQEASRKLGLGAKRTMQIAQALYEGIELGEAGAVGLITYMRTDSTRIADEAKEEAAGVIRERYGESYLGGPRKARAKKKGVQDAHEAIRPTSPARSPEQVSQYLDADQKRLYDLIWRRFIASQMADCLSDVTTVDIDAGPYVFRATGSVVTFKGFTAVYTEGKDEGESGEADRPPLPELHKGDPLRLLDLHSDQHFTQPPPRYTEATLVRALEQNGIGRPSTYAQILSVIVERGYTKLERKVFFPTPLGEAVSDFLVAAFPTTFEVSFTAHMETDLDRVEENRADWVEVVREFYGPLEGLLEKAMQIKGLESGKTCPNCGRPMVVKSGRSGEFLGCSGFPECRTTMPLDGKERPPDRPSDKTCPTCGKPMVVKTGRSGEFLGCSGFPECRTTMPLDGQSERAPERETGEKCPKCGRPMVVRRGRRGEFLACTGYPKCKTTRPLTGGTGIPCPVCGKGEMVERRSKRGRIFWGCSRYPECKAATWDKPTGEKCPECGEPLVEKVSKDGEVRVACQNRSCGYVKPGGGVDEAVGAASGE